MSSIGDVLIEDPKGQLFKLTPDLVRHVTPQNLKAVKGEGEHPLVRAFFNIDLLSTVPLADVNDDKVWSGLDLVTGTALDIYDAYDAADLRGKNILYHCSSTVLGFMGSCIAANECGLVVVEWDEAAKAIMNKQRLVYGEASNIPFYAMMPSHFRLPEVPVKQLFAIIEQGRIGVVPGKFTQPMEQRQLCDARNIAILGTVGEEITDRQHSLRIMGAKVEIYKGTRPDPVKQLAARKDAKYH